MIINILNKNNYMIVFKMIVDMKNITIKMKNMMKIVVKKLIMMIIATMTKRKLRMKKSNEIKNGKE